MIRETEANLALLVSALALELGPEWSPVEEEDRATHRLQKGDVILCCRQETYGSQAGRLEISGSYWHLAKGVKGGYTCPRSYGLVKHDEKEPSMGVAASRGAQVIAKEMKRRLLPEVERLTALMKVKVAEELEGQAQALRNAELLAQAVGGEVRADQGYGSAREIPVYANRDGVYLSARVSEKSVRFEHFTCDIETALAIGVTIRDYARAAAA